MADSLSDLLKRCRDGDATAYPIVIYRFQSKALDLAAALIGDKHLAEDAVQEAFYKAFCRLDQLRDPKAFAGWFRQIVRTEAIRLVRQKQPQQMNDFENCRDSQTPDAVTEQKELRQTIREAICELSETNRQTVEMFYLDEQSCADVADRLGVPAATVRRRLYDARQQLWKMLQKYL